MLEKPSTDDSAKSTLAVELVQVDGIEDKDTGCDSRGNTELILNACSIGSA